MLWGCFCPAGTMASFRVEDIIVPAISSGTKTLSLYQQRKVESPNQYSFRTVLFNGPIWELHFHKTLTFLKPAYLLVLLPIICNYHP